MDFTLPPECETYRAAEVHKMVLSGAYAKEGAGLWHCGV